MTATGRTRTAVVAGALAAALLVPLAARTAPATTAAGEQPFRADPVAAIAAAPGTEAAATKPRHRKKLRPPRHVVVVILENKGYSQIIGNPDAPYLNRLADRGALYTRSYASVHPSQPNYVVLFAGSTLGVSGDACPVSLTGPNLATQLLSSGRTFVGYAEGLPSTGWTGCSSGDYRRKHAPWTNFSNVPTSVSRPFTEFPARYATLPTVSWVIPDMQHDMHDGSIAEGDAWVRANLRAYARWAKTHRSLLIVTFDEDDFTPENRIPTIAYGDHVVRGPHGKRVTHCRVLRTLESFYGLPGLGCAATAAPVKSMWHR